MCELCESSHTFNESTGYIKQQILGMSSDAFATIASVTAQCLKTWHNVVRS